MSKIRVLANDGLHPEGVTLLEQAGFEVITEHIPPDALPTGLQDFDAVVVRSATKVREDLISQCPRLKAIARAGVGVDNIDVKFAESRGIPVFNTPAASSHSVAELVFAHMLSIARSLQIANREMPDQGNSEFTQLKKAYSGGIELKGKTLGIVGFGRIGQTLAKIAIGFGMKVCAVDPIVEEASISLDLPGANASVQVRIATTDMSDLLKHSDAISLHVPSAELPLIGSAEIGKMKQGVIIVNAARGGVVDEAALIAGLDSGQIYGAGLDVFVGEPAPGAHLLKHPRISLSPHIGASTGQAQANIGIELAEKLIGFLSQKLTT